MSSWKDRRVVASVACGRCRRSWTTRLSLYVIRVDAGGRTSHDASRRQGRRTRDGRLRSRTEDVRTPQGADKESFSYRRAGEGGRPGEFRDSPIPQSDRTVRYTEGRLCYARKFASPFAIAMPMSSCYNEIT